jgi:hypothetical protein
MPKGGLFVAHNVLNKKVRDARFPAHDSKTRPDLFYDDRSPSGEGVSVSWKRQ